MTTLERLGLVLLLYGVALHTWHHVPTLLVANLLLLAGAVLLVTGGPLERWLKSKFPSFPW